MVSQKKKASEEVFSELKNIRIIYVFLNDENVSESRCNITAVVHVVFIFVFQIYSIHSDTHVPP